MNALTETNNAYYETLRSNEEKALNEVNTILDQATERVKTIITNTPDESFYRDIQITFKRNIPSDNTDIVNMVKALQGIVSEKTLLSLIPQISDVEAELEAISNEKEANMEIYGFGNEK